MSNKAQNIFDGMSLEEVAEFGFSEGRKARPAKFDPVDLVEQLIGWIIHLKTQSECGCDICRDINEYIGEGD